MTYELRVWPGGADGARLVVPLPEDAFAGHELDEDRAGAWMCDRFGWDAGARMVARINARNSPPPSRVDPRP